MVGTYDVYKPSDRRTGSAASRLPFNTQYMMTGDLTQLFHCDNLG